MNIGEASQRSGLPPKTIRYYEEIGLVRPARAANGYRDYGEREVQVLRFLQRSRSLGFSLDEARRLLVLDGGEPEHAEAMRRVAMRQIGEIDRKIEELRSLRRALETLAEDEARSAGEGLVLDEIPGERARMPRRLVGA